MPWLPKLLPIQVIASCAAPVAPSSSISPDIGQFTLLQSRTSSIVAPVPKAPATYLCPLPPRAPLPVLALLLSFSPSSDSQLLVTFEPSLRDIILHTHSHLLTQPSFVTYNGAEMLAEGDPFCLLLMLLKYLLGKLASLLGSMLLLVFILFVWGCFVTAMQDRIDNFEARAFLLRVLGMILWAAFASVKVAISTCGKSLFRSSSFSFGIARPSALTAGSVPGSFPAGQREALAHNEVEKLQVPIVDAVNIFLLCIWSAVMKIGSWVGELWLRFPCNRPFEEPRPKWRIAEDNLEDELRKELFDLHDVLK